MGEFNAGRWIVSILIYFFILFIIINQIVIASNEYSVTNDAQFNDPGFGQSVVNIRGLCSGADASQTIGFCVLTLADDPTSCSALPSCVWNSTSEKCEGFSVTLCTSLQNETSCRLARCTWNTLDVPTQASLADKASVGSIRQTVNFITGINLLKKYKKEKQKNN